MRPITSLTTSLESPSRWCSGSLACSQRPANAPRKVHANTLAAMKTDPMVGRILPARVPADENRVGAAERERVRHDAVTSTPVRACRGRSRGRIRGPAHEIDRRRNDAPREREHAATNSSAPAAPSRCPCMDLVELTGIRDARAPNTSYRRGLDGIVGERGGAVRIDVADFVGAACRLTTTRGASQPPGLRGRRVMCVASVPRP